MSYQHLEIEVVAGIATLWMNRPQRHNAFDEALIAELTAAFAALDAEPDVRVVVLSARGKSFSAGADLDWMRRAADYGPDENLRDARALAAMLKTIDRMRKPTLARVQGAALGGGMGLVAACDIVIATAEASFATTEVRFGLVPAAISPYVLRAIGERMARRYFLTGERFDAQAAHAMGLVHEVVAPDKLDERVAQVVALLHAGGPSAQGAAKELVRDVAACALDDALLDATARTIAMLRATSEAREGIAAFLERRRPSWSTEKHES